MVIAQDRVGPEVEPVNNIPSTMEVQEKIKKLETELANLIVQFGLLSGTVNGFSTAFSTNQITALLGEVSALSGSSASFAELISSQFSFDASGTEATAAIIEPGTIVYGKTESDHIALIWLSEYFFFCITDSNNWRIDTNGNLINTAGNFDLFYVGTGAVGTSTAGTPSIVIAQGTSVFGQFNYYIHGTTTFEDIQVSGNANIKTLNVVDQITGTITEAVHAGSADTATSAGSATKDGSGNNIASTYKTKTEYQSDEYYQLGEEISFSSFISSGFVTTSGTVFYMPIILPKKIPEGSTVVITDVIGALRGASGYVDGSSNNYIWDPSVYTFDAFNLMGNQFQFRIKKNSGSLSNITNNTLGCFWGSCKITITNASVLSE